MKPASMRQSDDSIVLIPMFDTIPAELKVLHRWLLWNGKKIPWDAKFLKSYASATDPHTWASYEQACTAYDEGGFNGLGFALVGDGLVGIDLDSCVIDGQPSHDAMELMKCIGCEYIELSPSGTGLRGFGYVENPPLNGRKRTRNGLSIELYSTGRYLTVTGHVVKAGPLAHLHGYCELHQQLGVKVMTEVTEGTEVIEAIDFYSSVDPPAESVGERFPADTLPTGVGQRNTCIFLLARHLKGKYPTAELESMKNSVIEWYRQVLPTIRTKDFTETWLGFKAAWHNVKYPTGIMEKIVSGLDVDLEPTPVMSLGQAAEKLYRLCSRLQRHQGNEPFFISCRDAGHAIGISHDYANNLLKEFCALGLLEQTFKGVRGKASRYLLKGRSNC